MFVLLFPGQKSALVTLQSVLKERHDNLQAHTAREIQRRTARGVPLDDGAGPLTALDDYVDVDGYGDVQVRFVALAEKRRAELLADVQVAVAARAAFAGKDVVVVGKELPLADAAIEDAQLAFIKAAVCELRDSNGVVDLSSESVAEAIRATGSLLAHLFVAARDYQGLSPGKEKRFGSQQPSTT